MNIKLVTLKNGKDTFILFRTMLPKLKNSEDSKPTYIFIQGVPKMAYKLLTTLSRMLKCT
jgi:hypothetical protein